MKVSGMRAAALAAALSWAAVTNGLRADEPIASGLGGVSGHALECAQNTVGSVRVTPEAIKLGETVSVTWSSRQPANCRFQVRLSGGNVDATGSRVEKPMSSRTYRLTLFLPGGSKTLAEASLRVELPAVVEITGSTTEWAHLLIQAVGEPGKTVRLAEGVDMDLSGQRDIRFASGVTLTSEWPGVPVFHAQPTPRPGPVILHTPPPRSFPGAGGTVFHTASPAPAAGGGTVFHGASPAPFAHRPATVDARGPGNGVVWDGGLVSYRTPRKLGPRLFTKTRPHPLFVLEHAPPYFGCDNVRLYGFRLIGPEFATEQSDANMPRAIHINGCLNVEIANMELAGWSGQAVYVTDGDPNGRISNPDAIKIHDNFFHHNQHKGGNGYGVDVSAGGYADIRHNLFDFNRHAIAASGKPGVGYRAHQNLILRGGGDHDRWYNPHTHQVDVHGDDNCFPPGGSSTWNCGNAGDRFWITENSFQFVADHAIKLRGVPRVEATIADNVFAHDSVGDAVALRENTRVRMGEGAHANRANVSTYGEYGLCDFDGDGRDDLFLATGRTWWFSSGARMQWSYLKDATERLSQVGFGDFDGDRRCDVIAAAAGDRWEISSGGSGPWTSLPGTYPVPFEELRFADFDGDRITDVFRRAPNGQWSIVSPGHFGWRDIQSSGFPLAELRFGDFTGDGVTDVLGMNGGHWSISRSGTGSWEDLNRGLSTPLSRLLIADVDGNRRDDVLRFEIQGPGGGKWQVSWNGTTGWQDLSTVRWTAESVTGVLLTRAFVGRFDDAPGADPLIITPNRQGELYSRAAGRVVRHSLYAF